MPLSTSTVLLTLSLVLLAGCHPRPAGGPGAWPGRQSPTIDIAPGDPRSRIREAEAWCSRTAGPNQRSEALTVLAEAWQSLGEESGPALAVSRCASLVADTANDRETVLSLTDLGIRAAETAGARNGDPEACYYLAVHIGLTLREQGLKAIEMLPRMVENLERAAQRPHTDSGGPLRVLGMVYLQAPPWPIGIGDLERALELLERAAREYPTHPQNHLFYAQALIEDEDLEGALTELDLVKQTADAYQFGDYAARWRREAEKLQQVLIFQ